MNQESNLGDMLNDAKRQLGCDGKRLKEIAEELLEIINRNPTQAVVALASHGWVLVAQQELDAERQDWRRKLEQAANVPARQPTAAIGIADAIDTILQVAADEDANFSPPVLQSLPRLLRSLKESLQ